MTAALLSGLPAKRTLGMKMTNAVAESAKAVKPERSVLDTIEKLLKIGKEAAVIVVVAMLFFKLLPLASMWIDQLAASKIDALDLWGIKLVLAKEKLQTLAGVGQPQGSPSDKVVSPVATERAAAVQAIETQIAAVEPLAQPTRDTVPPVPGVPATNRKASFWAYLGISRGSQLQTKNFQTSTLPNKGQLITATTEVYKRTGPPVQKGDEWFLSETKGVLRSKQTVRVLNLEKIESTESGAYVVWAEVEPE